MGVLLTNSAMDTDGSESRRLSESDNDHLLGGCDGPKALMGIIYIIVMGYNFLGLAVVCDDFFCSALESLSEYYKLSDDVAGATFMAAGSSAPELFTAMVDTFYFKSNVGLGTIIGSAIFNIMVIIAASAAFSKATLQIDWRPLARDVAFYLVSIVLLMGFSTSSDEGVGFSWPSMDSTHGNLTWQEGLILIVWYLLYILFMCFNERILGPMGDDDDEGETSADASVAVAPAADGPAALEEGKNALASAPPVALDNADATLEKDREETKGPPEADIETAKLTINAGGDGDAGTVVTESSSRSEKVLEVLSAPWTFAFKCTIPNCEGDDVWKHMHWITFINSCLWIGIISWLLVFCASNFGCLVGLDPIVMGVTFLAAGTSVPDAISSIVVAKEGKGGMAVANAIGSNVFDICLGLGIPTFIACAFGIEKTIVIATDNIVDKFFWLLGSLAIVVVTLLISKWRLTPNVGKVLFFVYVAFVIYSFAKGA